MKEMERIIDEQGTILPGDILKIDNFLNHRIDMNILDLIGKEFFELFKDTNPDIILTIESSGIAIASASSRYFNNIPVLFAKKTYALNMSDNTYQSREHSYTRDIDYNVQVSKDYLSQDLRVLILDDFLANGEAMNSMIDICNQAGATIVGCGAVVCKTYQPGLKRIKDMGYHVECLANVKGMSDNSIEFED